VDVVPFTLLSLNTSRAHPLDINGRSVMSGIVKRSVDGPRAVGRLGIEGDEQADLDRPWRPQQGRLCVSARALPVLADGPGAGRRRAWDDVLPYGALGENLTVSGLLENRRLDRRPAALSQIARSPSANRATRAASSTR
jgi:MOSC domain-containing protein YiiM